MHHGNPRAGSLGGVRRALPGGLLLTAALCAAAVARHAVATPVSYALVTIGSPDNAPDPATGSVYGSVAASFSLGTYPVTIAQYAAFLNAVAQTDTYGLYKPAMNTNLNVAGIEQTGASGGYAYAAVGPAGIAAGQSAGGRPIAFTSWFDAARFANWMSNGQPTGGQSATTTENGAYDLSDASSGTAPALNQINPHTGLPPLYHLPTESQWYKGAFYDPQRHSGSEGYWAYATQSDLPPGNQIGGEANQANYRAGGVYAVTQSGSFSTTQNYLTDVGMFTGSGSAYGTFDQSGSVYEWNDLTGEAGTVRGLRGGWYSIDDPFWLSSSGRLEFAATTALNNTGFRLASTAVVPEPAVGLLLAGAAGGVWLAAARRRRGPSRPLPPATSLAGTQSPFIRPRLRTAAGPAGAAFARRSRGCQRPPRDAGLPCGAPPPAAWP